MKSPHVRLFLASQGLLLGFCLLYLLALVGLPGPIYHPHERFWSLTMEGSSLGMLYFRQLGWGVMGGLVGGGLGLLGGRWVSLSREAVLLLAGWTVTLVLITGLYSGFQAFYSG